MQGGAQKRKMDEAPLGKVKKKPLAQPQSLYLVKREDGWTEMPEPSISTVKVKRKRNPPKTEPASPLQHLDRSTSHSLPDSSFDNEYRALRHKYLLLEEENSQLGRELGAVESEVKGLEDEKHALLDKLVVLEGLIDSSELQPQQSLYCK